MTDMTVTPTTEEHDNTMKAFQQVFDFVSKARDAVIQASSLAAEVAEMRKELTSLKTEIEAAHLKNAEFETSLGFVRAERDQALQTAQDWERQYVVASQERDSAKRDLEVLQSEHVATADNRDALATQLTAERLETRRLQDELDAERAAHAKLKQEIESIHSRLLQPQPRTEGGQFSSFDAPAKASGW